MGIRQVNLINQSLKANIEAARNGRIIRSNNSEAAAQHLKTKEDLAAFYGRPENAEVTGWVVATVTYMVTVAVGALTFAAAGGGQVTQSADPTSNWDFDLSDFSVEELLDKRHHLLT